MRSISKRILTALAATGMAATLFVAGTPGSALASDPTTVEVESALEAVDARSDHLVVESVPSVTDADSAAQTAHVDIPTDPTKGVKLQSEDGQTFTLQLPNVRKNDRGTKARNGAVVYGTQGDSVNAVVPSTEGTTQLWTHIRNKRAPETYRYCMDGVRFVLTPDGGAAAYNASNEPVGFLPSPTATEKKTGKAVKTSYRTDGSCITQHVAHKAKGVSYPVVADPFWIPISGAAVVAAFTAGVYACGLGYLAGAAWQIFWNGWVWQQVRRAGREGCVEGVVARFFPVSWFRALIKR